MSYGYNNNQGYPYQQGGYQGYSPSAQHRPPPPGTPQQQQQQGYGSYGRPPPPQMNQGGYPPQQNYGKCSIEIKRERERERTRHSCVLLGRPPGPPGCPPGADAQLWGWFTAVDSDHSGQLSVDELQRALVNGDWSPFNIETVRTMVNMFDKGKKKIQTRKGN